MFKVQAGLYIAAFINKVEVPLDVLGFVSFQMHSNTKFAFPIGKLVIVDSIQWFDKNPVEDNAPVVIHLGTTDSTKNPQYKFRLFKKNVRVNGSLKTYELHLVYNAPRFINENSVGALKGTASTAMQIIAQQSDITKTKIDQSSDAMTWYPFGLKRSVVAKSITKHAYADANSCFSASITLDGTFHFRNISAITKPSYTLVKGAGAITGNTIPVLGEKEKQQGVQNNLTGYKYETIEQSIDSSKSHTKVDIKTTSQSLAVNKKLNAGLEGSRVRVTPVSSNNTHPFYYQAEHQNLRILNSYNLGLHVVSSALTNIDLYDCVTYVSIAPNMPDKVNPTLTGIYLVAAKTVYIKGVGANYYEKFELVRQGYNFASVNKQDLLSITA